MKNLLRICFKSIRKPIKVVLVLFLFLTVTSINAQNDQKLETSTVYTANIETMDGQTIPYRIRVNETRQSTINFAAKDKGKTDQTAIYSPEYVTKVIYIDKDADDVYNTHIVLRYKKDPNDSFEFKPTKRGFSVEVNKKYVEYIFGKGVYFVNNEDADYFSVTEFDEY